MKEFANKIAIFFKKNNDLYNCILLSIISILLCCYFYNLGTFDFKVPIEYTEGDGLFAGSIVKSLGENGQYFTNPLLGAPFGSVNYDFPMYGDAFHLLFIQLFYAVFGHFGIAINCFFFMLFPATAVISYLVMRKLGIKRVLSFIGSLTYAFLPYRFLRSEEHLFLSAYTLIPLAVLVLFWLMSDDRLFKIQKGFLTYKRNIYTAIILIVVAISGIYYTFFTCFFVFIAVFILFCSSKSNRNMKTVLKAIIPIGIMAVTIMIASIPTRIGLSNAGINVEAPTRMAYEAEIYGLKITRLFIPIQDHGIPVLRDILTKYSYAPLQSEKPAYLGILGIFGFVTLVLSLFIKFNNDNENNLGIKTLSKLNIAAVLLGTIGGFGSLFALLVSAQIRAYNRISVFIAYFCVLAACMLLDSLTVKIKRTAFRRIALCAIAMVLLLGIREQSLPLSADKMNNLTASYYSDENFVKDIEADVGAGSMIYQMPYFQFPETAPMNNMADYALFRGYLHSDTLKWSYGDYKGRNADLWNRIIASYPLDQRIQAITFAGFRGIYIDTYAFTDDDLTELESSIEAILNEQPIISDDGRLVFYSLADYSADLKSQYSQEEWNEKAYMVLGIPILAGGFYGEEPYDNGTFQWCQKSGELSFYNADKTDRTVNIAFMAITGYPEDSILKLSGAGIDKTYRSNMYGTAISERLTLKPGWNSLKFTSDAKLLKIEGEKRKLCFQVRDLAIDYQ